MPGPVARFLGEGCASGGPFALLGLGVRDASSQEVLAALERQLEAVAAHREGDTPSADEVRLALHAAAAQLLDEHVRRRLVERWGGVVTARATPHRRLISDRPLELDAIMTLGMYGGWNRRSLQRLLSLAHARGIGNREVAATLSRLAGRRTRWRPARVKPGTPLRRPQTVERTLEEEILEEQQDPMIYALRIAMFVGVVIVALALVGGLAFWLASRAGGGRVEEHVAATTPAPGVERGSIFDSTKPDMASRPAEIGEAQKPTPLERGEIAMRLQEALDGLQYDVVQAKTDFLAALAALQQSWASLDPDDRIASNQRVIEFVYRTMSRADMSREVLEGMSAGAAALGQGDVEAKTVLPAAWSIGMLSRLSRERDLSAMAEGIVRRHLGDALGHAGGAGAATFDEGARAALGAIAGRLARGAESSVDDREEAWQRWLAGLDAVAPQGSADRERLLLSAVETILTRGPEPTSDKATFDAIGLLISRISWAEDSEARVWLVRWFADRRVSADDLHAVTMALVTRTRARGVTQLMTLSAAASDAARRDMREAYIVAWGLEQSVRLEGLLADWVSASEEALKVTASDPASNLESSVRLSRLSEVASLLWRGQSAEADALLEGVELPLTQLRGQAKAHSTGTQPGEGESGGRWMVKYLEAGRNIPLRMSLLEDLGRQAARMGPADAEILAREAMRGSPSEVRERARQVALASATNGNIVNGVLEELPRVRGDDETSRFIEGMAGVALPPARAPTWPIAARRALVERLLELTAASGEFAWVDALSQSLAASYEDRASSQPIPDQVPLTRTVPEVADSCEALWHEWMASAEAAPGSGGAALEELVRQRAGRVALARGLVQRFAAEQVSVCELAAHVVERERPGAGPTVALIMADLTDRRRRAGHVFEQIDAGERAMLRLWMARLAEESM